MDWSEDDLFIGYDKTNKLGFVENDFTKEDMEDMNNNVSIDSVLYLKKEHQMLKSKMNKINILININII